MTETDRNRSTCIARVPIYLDTYILARWYLRPWESGRKRDFCGKKRKDRGRVRKEAWRSLDRSESFSDWRHSYPLTYICVWGNVYVRSSRNCRQKINPGRHAVVCINIGKSMVTRDVGVPPQNGPIGLPADPHRGNLLHLPARASACSFRSRLLHRPDARDRERCWKGSTLTTVKKKKKKKNRKVQQPPVKAHDVYAVFQSTQ